MMVGLSDTPNHVGDGAFYLLISLKIQILKTQDLPQNIDSFSQKQYSHLLALRSVDLYSYKLWRVQLYAAQYGEFDPAVGYLQK
jgi:hypothetical protein